MKPAEYNLHWTPNGYRRVTFMTSTLASQRPPQLSSPALTRRSFPRRNRIHYDNRSKELLVEKQDSPICPSSHLTSHFFSRRRTSRDGARNIFHEGQFLYLTVPAKRSMISGHFKHEVNDSRAVVADFYYYIWCVDVEHRAQVGGILKFYFPRNNGCVR